MDAKVARVNRRIANQRSDCLHKLTTRLAKSRRVIVIEDLNVRGMLANRHLARAVGDQGFGELRRQLTYKTEWYGSKLIVADRFFPSSKICSECGGKNQALTLKDRVFECPTCGASLDRDANAARNLAALAATDRTTVRPTGSNACGEEGSGSSPSRRAKPASAKQEASGRKSRCQTRGSSQAAKAYEDTSGVR